ncbi:gluconokinase [Rhodanobacter fulvus]|nr:gluconokinase [Rhodanobacter fulvus]
MTDERQKGDQATIVVVMGVSGSGKTTVARELAQQLNWEFLEGDSVHPPANVAKMSAGTPLNDDDRWPWLEAIVKWMSQRLQRGESAVVACSALRRIYRDHLRQAGAGVRFAYLHVPHDELARRMRSRDHFMPPSLLDSQLATLEEPGPDEDALRVTEEHGVEASLAAIVDWACRPSVDASAPADER